MSTKKSAGKSAAPQDRIQAFMSAAIAAGDLIEAEDFRKRLGVPLPAFHQAETEGAIFGIDFAGARVYPRFLLDERYNQHSLREVAKLLASVSPGARYLFFISSNAALADAEGRPCSPLHALAAGLFDQVRRAAAARADE